MGSAEVLNLSPFTIVMVVVWEAHKRDQVLFFPADFTALLYTVPLAPKLVESSSEGPIS